MIVLGDTCWYVDYAAGRHGTREFAMANSGMVVVGCTIVRGELVFGRRSLSFVDALFGPGTLLTVDPETADIWGVQSERLKSAGLSIGPNDLWIAAIALRHGLPVLTRNVGEFSRVPELTVVAYGKTESALAV